MHNAHVYHLITFADESLDNLNILLNTQCMQHTILYFITFINATRTIFGSAFKQDTFISYDIKLFKNVHILCYKTI